MAVVVPSGNYSLTYGGGELRPYNSGFSVTMQCNMATNKLYGYYTVQ